MNCIYVVTCIYIAFISYKKQEMKQSYHIPDQKLMEDINSRNQKKGTSRILALEENLDPSDKHGGLHKNTCHKKKKCLCNQFISLTSINASLPVIY